MEEKNSWDQANRQGHNRDFNIEGSSDDMFLKEDQAADRDVQNPTQETEGFGSQSSRHDDSHYMSGYGSRTGNNDSESKQHGTRSDHNSSSGSSGGGGRAHGDMGDYNTD